MNYYYHKIKNINKILDNNIIIINNINNNKNNKTGIIDNKKLNYK